MEVYGNTMENFTTSKKIEECRELVNTYVNGMEFYSDIKMSNGTQVINCIFEKFSFRNTNFMTIYMNIVSEDDKTEVFFAIKERQEGFLTFSLGKKKKLTEEIKRLLI